MAQYSLSETAEKLRKSLSEINELVKSGKLKPIYIGTEIFFAAEEVDGLISRPELKLATESGTDDDIKLADTEADTKKFGEESLDTSKLEIGDEGDGLLDLEMEPGATAFGDDFLDEISPEQAGILPGPDDIEIPEGPARVLQPSVSVVQESKPTLFSNALGITLLIAGVAVIFTLIAAAGGKRGFLPQIIIEIKSYIWFIVFGLMFLMAIIWGFAFSIEKGMLSSFKGLFIKLFKGLFRGLFSPFKLLFKGLSKKKTKNGLVETTKPRITQKLPAKRKR